MVTDNDYRELLNKYNILISKYDDMVETNIQNEAEWKREEQEYNDLCDRVRELCENIFNKSQEIHDTNKKNMQELVHSTKLAFEEYSHKRNEIIKVIVKESEDKSAEIENLKNQISQMLVSENSYSGTPVDAINEATEENRDADVSNTVPEEKTHKKLKDFGKKKSANIETVVEGDADEEEQARNLIAAAAAENINSVIKKTPAFNQNFKPPKPKIDREPTGDDYDKIKAAAENLKDIHWEILTIMGKQGLSRMTKIVDAFGGRKTQGAIRQGINTLKDMGLLAVDTAINPFSKNLMVYHISEAGNMVYKFRYHQNPVKSEMKKIINEHDNLEHGYGILFLYELMLQDPARFTDVSMFNKKNPIDYGSGNNKEVYVPDIQFKENGKQLTFYEYERVNQGQLDYERKMNKLLRVTRYIYFIVDTKDTLDKMIKIVNKWVDKKNPKELDGYKLKICTATYFRDKLITNKTALWQAEYDFAKSNKPSIITKDVL